MDVFPFVVNGEGFMIKTFALAAVAGNPLIFEKIHIDADHPHPVTLRTRSISHIETKPTRQKSSCYTIGKLAKKRADFIKDFDIGSWIGTGSAANRELDRWQ